MIHEQRGHSQVTLIGERAHPCQRVRLLRLTTVFGTVLIVAGFAVGCGDKSAETPSTSTAMTNQSSDNASRGAPVAPAQVQQQTLDVKEGADSAEVVAELNRELRRWVMRNRRKPANFQEFVSTAQMQVPPAPPGKKYTLTSEMRIELVNK